MVGHVDAGQKRASGDGSGAYGREEQSGMDAFLDMGDLCRQRSSRRITGSRTMKIYYATAVSGGLREATQGDVLKTEKVIELAFAASAKKSSAKRCKVKGLRRCRTIAFRKNRRQGNLVMVAVAGSKMSAHSSPHC